MPAEERRADFIAAAARAIARHGVAGATTRVIAAEADAPLAALHYCFRSKEELFMELVDHASTSMMQMSVVEPGLGLGPTAAAVLEQHAQWLLREPELGLSTYDLYLWALPRSRELADRAVERTHTRLVTTLQRGLLPVDDPSLVRPLARMTVVLMDGLALQWFLHRDEERLAAELDDASRALDLLAMSRMPSATVDSQPA
ncbi:TetR family transcriptional regulator [Blastococcus sp. SYSU D00695]